MTEGPRESGPEPAKRADEGPIEPETESEPESVAPPEPQPDPPPAPPLWPEPGPESRHEERDFPLVVAARQPEPGSTADHDVLYIVPAAQAAPAPVVVRAPESPPEPEPSPAPRRGPRPGCFAFLLLLVIVIVAGAAYAYQSGVLTPRLVLNAAGFAAAELEVVNLRPARIGANLEVAGPEGESFPAAIRLEPYDIVTHRAARPNDLRVTVVDEDGAPFATCLLRLRAGDRYRIVVLPDASLVQRGDAPPVAAAELMLDTSSLCR